MRRGDGEADDEENGENCGMGLRGLGLCGDSRQRRKFFETILMVDSSSSSYLRRFGVSGNWCFFGILYARLVLANVWLVVGAKARLGPACMGAKAERTG